MITFEQYFTEVKFKFVRDVERGNKKKEKLVGGKADGMSLEDIFDMHKEKNPSLQFKDLLKEFQLGLKIESEHTSDSKVAAEIVRDHLYENFAYYSQTKPEHWAEKELAQEENE